MEFVKRHISVQIVLIIFIIFLITDCSNFTNSSTETITETRAFTDEEVILITGKSGNQIIWRIKEIQRKNAYFSGSLELVEGDSVVIRGEAVAETRNVFLQGEKPSFDLLTSEGVILKRQLVMTEV